MTDMTATLPATMAVPAPLSLKVQLRRAERLIADADLYALTKKSRSGGLY